MGRKTNRNDLTQLEAHIISYYESLAVRERLARKTETLEKQKEEFTAILKDRSLKVSEESLAEAEKRLFDINSQILMYTTNMSILNMQYLETEQVLSELNERDAELIRLRCKLKKSYVAIGFAMFMSDTRAHQLRSQILEQIGARLLFCGATP